MEAIIDVSGKATAEQGLEEMLDKVKKTWEDLELVINPYKAIEVSEVQPFQPFFEPFLSLLEAFWMLLACLQVRFLRTARMSSCLDPSKTSPWPWKTPW